MIEQDKKTKKWILYTSDSSRILGTHKTYEGALRQERAIQWSKHRRSNPYIFKDELGFLYNPTFQWPNWERNIDSTIWVHGTDKESALALLKPNAKPSTKAFHIASLDTAYNFGEAFVFVRYKPTKLFDGQEDLTDEILNYIVNSIFSTKESLEEFLEYYSNKENIDFHNETEIGSVDDLRDLLKSEIGSLDYFIFENPFVREALIYFGFTAYIESESAFREDTNYRYMNIAILKTDFDNIEFVSALVPDVRNKRSIYRCPNCNGIYDSPNDFVMSIILNDGEILCKACDEGSDCDSCGSRFPNDLLEEFYEDGYLIKMCDNCNQYCEECEERFKEEDLNEDGICEECLQDLEGDDHRGNPTLRSEYFKDRIEEHTFYDDEVQDDLWYRGAKGVGKDQGLGYELIGNGLYVTRNLDFADGYASKHRGGKVFAYYVNPDINVMDTHSSDFVDLFFAIVLSFDFDLEYRNKVRLLRKRSKNGDFSGLNEILNSNKLRNHPEINRIGEVFKVESLGRGFQGIFSNNPEWGLVLFAPEEDSTPLGEFDADSVLHGRILGKFN